MKPISHNLGAFFKALGLGVGIVLVSLFFILTTINGIKAGGAPDGKGYYRDENNEEQIVESDILWCHGPQGYFGCELKTFLFRDFGFWVLYLGGIPLLILTPIFYKRFRRKS